MVGYQPALSGYGTPHETGATYWTHTNKLDSKVTPVTLGVKSSAVTLFLLLV